MNTFHITTDRVRRATSSGLNEAIDREIEDNIQYYSLEPDEVIHQRLEQLDKEWDIERTLELNASVLAFIGVVLSASVSKKWLFLPGLVTAFLAQHAIQGWCPPLPLLRKFKIRTRKEIDKEKFGLLEVLKNKDRPAFDPF